MIVLLSTNSIALFSSEQPLPPKSLVALAAGGLAAVGFAVVGLAFCIEQVVRFVVVVVAFAVVRFAIVCTVASGLAAVGFAVVGLVVCIEQFVGFVSVVVGMKKLWYLQLWLLFILQIFG